MNISAVLVPNLTLPLLTRLAPLKSLITLYINICKITFFPSTQYAYIYDSIFICKLCYKDKLGQTYICILSGREKCDKYAIIFICKLCYKDKLEQTDKVIVKYSIHMFANRAMLYSLLPRCLIMS